MRKATLGLLIIFVFTVFGCSAPASPTQPIVDTSASTSPTLTQTPLLTATKPPVTPTITPEPGLRTNGPYFTYFREVNGEYQFVMMDADGVGRKVISIPIEITDSLPDTLKALNMQFVSRDGKWLAVYTGGAGVSDVFPPQGKVDLTLNLFNFSTGELQVVKPLLSRNYPNNFRAAAERLNNPSITDVTLYQAFLNGITRSIAWSPDGRYLAFAGQMDGLSSDLYVYEMETKAIRRLSSGDQQLQLIQWSPDSKWILYNGTFEIGIGMKFDVYVAAVDGSSVKHLSANSSGFPVWMNSHTYLEYDDDYELGTIFGLRLVDITTGQIRKIWDGPVMNFGLNTEKTKLAFVTRMFAHSPYLGVDPDPNFVPGLYLMDLNTFTVTNVKTPDSFDFSESYFINPFDLNVNF